MTQTIFNAITQFTGQQKKAVNWQVNILTLTWIFQGLLSNGHFSAIDVQFSETKIKNKNMKSTFDNEKLKMIFTLIFQGYTQMGNLSCWNWWPVIYRNTCTGISKCTDKLWTSRDHFVYAPSQWETTLQCNVVSHWLGAYTKLSLNQCWGFNSPPWGLTFCAMEDLNEIFELISVIDGWCIADTFKVKYGICYISAKNGLIATKRKANISIEL